MGTGSVVYFCGTMKPFLIIMFLAVFGLNCHAGWRKKDPFLAHADLQDLVVEFLGDGSEEINFPKTVFKNRIETIQFVIDGCKSVVRRANALYCVPWITSTRDKKQIEILTEQRTFKFAEIISEHLDAEQDRFGRLKIDTKLVRLIHTKEHGGIFHNIFIKNPGCNSATTPTQ